MNQAQKQRQEDMQLQEQNVLFNNLKDSSAGATSLANMRLPSPSGKTSGRSSLGDGQLQQEVNYVIQKAMQTFGKTDERDLTLVEILKQFEQIVEEDATAGSADCDPQLQPMQRSKIYLQLLKYKKAQEMKELEEINDSIDKYKSKSSTSKHQTVGSIDAKAELEDRSDGQAVPVFKRATKQQKSKKSNAGEDCQMIPEKLPPGLSNASSKVSLKLGKRDLEVSQGTDSTTFNRQLSQVSLKMSNDRMTTKLLQASTNPDQRMAGEQEKAHVGFNASGEARRASVGLAAGIQVTANEAVPRKDQYVTFSQDEEDLANSIQLNLKRNLQSPGLERIEEGPEELQPSPAYNPNENLPRRRSAMQKSSLLDRSPGRGIRREPVSAIAGPRKTAKGSSWRPSYDGRASAGEKADALGKGRAHAQALKASQKYKRQMSKQQSAELLPKKKYVSLRPGRHAPFTDHSRRVLQSTSLGGQPEQLAAEPPLQSAHHREAWGQRNSSTKSNEKTPSLHNSKSRSIGKRKLTRHSGDNQARKSGTRSPALVSADRSKPLRTAVKDGKGAIVRRSNARSSVSDKSQRSKDFVSNDVSRKNHLSPSAPFTNQRTEGSLEEKLAFNKFGTQNPVGADLNPGYAEDGTRLHYFNKLQENLQNQLDREYQQVVSQHPSITSDGYLISQGRANAGLQNLNDFNNFKANMRRAPEVGLADAIKANAVDMSSQEAYEDGAVTFLPERNTNVLSRSQLSNNSNENALWKHQQDYKQNKQGSTNPEYSVKGPGRDLMSIKSQKSQNKQTIGSGSSPTERIEVEQVIEREPGSAWRPRRADSTNEGDDSVIKNVAEFSENEEKSRWEVISANTAKQGSKMAGKSKRLVGQTTGDVKKKGEFGNRAARTEEQSRQDGSNEPRRKHRFNPSSADKQSPDALRRQPVNLRHAEPKVTWSHGKAGRASEAPGKSPHSQRSPRSQAQDGTLQASSSTVMYSPLMPERRRQPVSARANEEAVPYHVRSGTVQNQIEQFLHDDGLQQERHHGQKERGSGSFSRPVAQDGKIRSILKPSPSRSGQDHSRDLQQPDPHTATANFMGDSSINQFKQFVMEQMKEDSREEEQYLQMNDREEDDETIKVHRVAVGSGEQDIYLGHSLLTKSNPIAQAELLRASELEPVSIKDTSQMLVYALHYEVKLMRKAFQVIQANSLINQTQKLNYKISKQRYLKSLKMKALRSLHSYYINHFGNATRNQQAATLSRYLLSRKYLSVWIQEYRRYARYREAIEEMRQRICDRTKLNVFMEWQQIQLAHQLYKVQKETAETFWKGRAIKKAYLSIKYFVKFSIKRARLHTMALGHGKQRLFAKVLLGLRQNIEVQSHKKDKIRIAFHIYDQNCQKRAFRHLRIICMERVVDRINRRKARDFLVNKLQRICWNHWRIYRIEQEKERLNAKLASEFREQIMGQIFREIYSDRRLKEVARASRLRQCFRQLKLNRDMKLAIINQLPKRLSYFYYAHAWASDYGLSKYSQSARSKLVSNFEKNVEHYYLVKCFYTLQSTYEGTRELRARHETRLVQRCFNMLRRQQLKKGAGRYKQRMIEEKVGFNKLVRIFYVLKLFTKKRSQCKKVAQYLEASLSDRRKSRVLTTWHRLWTAQLLKRQQKEISLRMHRDRFVTTYFRAWMERYNKSQRKKYLQDIHNYYRRERVRNKIFTVWMQKVTTSIDGQLRERQASLDYQDRRMLTVLDALRGHCIRKKRERLISQIIKEKNESITVIRMLEQWRRRLHERMEKHELYDQVVRDREARIMDLVFWTLKLNVEERKEQAVLQLAARRQSDGLESRASSSQSLAQAVPQEGANLATEY